VAGPKRFVYIITSTVKAATCYVGVTSDVSSRLAAHNAGLNVHTARDRPWRVLVVVEFDEEAPARKFESYLKTGSGREFARRHFRRTVSGRSVRDRTAGGRV
jgi:predicted GIY-YIG superfamily endonuclease